MCGITGSIWTDPTKQIDRNTLHRMTSALAHRGPDDEGEVFSGLNLSASHGIQPGVALGFRRLSIIDLGGGHQPIANEDESVWVVFNGEIYNFEVLRRRLEGSGHRFRTQSDSETIVHLYEDEGTDCFKHLNGMFSIAIWDSRKHRLVLGRDRLGQKPLYYFQEPGRVLFASELKSLLEVEGVPREVDANSLDEYLAYQYVPYPNSILQGVKKLPPAHFAVFDTESISSSQGASDGAAFFPAELKSSWQPNFNFESTESEADAVHQLRELMESSVQLRMQSDVPLGAFLSGGVDSSLIVALMQKQSATPVKTFSIGFPIEEYDETAFAQQVANALGTEHHEFQVTPDCVEILPKLAWHYDEPFADSSAIPTWYVSEMTRQHVTVALSGDGGDELFAGYPRYKAIRLGSYIDRMGPFKNLLAAAAWQKLPGSARQKGLLRRFKRFSSAIAMPSLRRYFDWIGIFNETRRAELYTDEFVEKLSADDPFDFLLRAYQKSEHRDPVTAVSLADLTTYLTCDLNNKVDIASMAHGLEVRQPFLDHRLVEFAAALPIKHKFRWLKGKRILKSAFGEMLPEAIWNRPKMGFGVPLDYWFRNELREMTHDLLLSSRAVERGYFRKETVQRLLSEHESKTFDHAYRLWSLLVLELWHREWIDR